MISSAIGAEVPPVFSLETKSENKTDARTSSKLIVDRVEFSGVTVLGEDRIEGALDIGPGDRYDPSLVLRTASNMKSLYQAHGYERVRIRTQLLKKKISGGNYETVLEFNIEEGKPTRIAQVVVVPEGDAQVASLVNRIRVAPGSILEQKKIDDSKSAIQDLLASHEYIGAQAGIVKIEQVSMPSGMQDVSTDHVGATDHWVKVEFHVRLGDRVNFGFRGNQVFSAIQLLGFVEDQRVLGFGKDYVISIKNRIEQEYRALGYSKVKIQIFTFEKKSIQERHVSYEIEEGPRMVLSDVTFDGNEAFSTKELKEEFYAKASPVIRQGYYSEVDAKNAAEQLIEWMKSKGYLSAKFVAMNAIPLTRRQAGRLTSSVKLTVYVYESDQTILRNLELKGITAFSLEEIKNTLGIHEGEPLNLGAFSQGLEAIKALYRTKGYLGLRILNEDKSDQVVQYFDENRIADIFLNLSEGPRFRASKILIEGLSLTQEKVVWREIPLHQGDFLEEDQLTETEARLRKLGIFSSVTLKLSDDPDREGYKIVRILLQESIPGIVSGGLGFRNDLGIRAFSGISYNNLWGRNHTLAFDVNANRRLDTYHFGEFQTQLAYVWPWFLNHDLTFRPNFTVSGQQYRLFDAHSVSLAATFEKRFFPHLTGALSYTLERVEQFNATVYPQDNQGVTIGALMSTLKLDYRDHPLAPTRGFFGSTSLEYAAPWLLSQLEGFPVSFMRFQLRTDYFVPLTDEVIWYLSFRMGVARNFEPVQLDSVTGQVLPLSGAIPTIKQFALGGAGSLRGFTEQQLNHQNVMIHGTQSYVNYRTQIDFPISGNLRFGPFLDAANLQLDAFSLDHLRLGAGMGFHYQTPLGPVNMDMGFNLDPQIDQTTGRPEPSSMIYFTIGVI